MIELVVTKIRLVTNDNERKTITMGEDRQFDWRFKTKKELEKFRDELLARNKWVFFNTYEMYFLPTNLKRRV